MLAVSQNLIAVGNTRVAVTELTVRDKRAGTQGEGRARLCWARRPVSCSEGDEPESFQEARWSAGEAFLIVLLRE